MVPVAPMTRTRVCELKCGSGFISKRTAQKDEGQKLRSKNHLAKLTDLDTENLTVREYKIWHDFISLETDPTANTNRLAQKAEGICCQAG